METVQCFCVGKDYVSSGFSEVNDLTCERVLSLCELKTPEWVDAECKLSFEDFCACVSQKCIMDYDGFGELFIDGKPVSNASIVCDQQHVKLGDKAVVSFNTLKRLFGNDRLTVYWYNK